MALFLIVLIIVYIPLLFWVMFLYGFWIPMVILGVSAYASAIVQNLSVYREEKNQEVLYNPREIPLYISRILLLAMPLYVVINVEQVDDSAMMRLGIYTYVGVSIFFALNNIKSYFRNRNDFIKLTTEGFQWVDKRPSKTIERFIPWKDIESVSINGSKLRFHFVGGKQESLNTGFLNFDNSYTSFKSKGVRRCFEDIKSYIERYGSKIPQ